MFTSLQLHRTVNGVPRFENSMPRLYCTRRAFCWTSPFVPSVPFQQSRASLKDKICTLICQKNKIPQIFIQDSLLEYVSCSFFNCVFYISPKKSDVFLKETEEIERFERLVDVALRMLSVSKITNTFCYVAWELVFHNVV